MTSVYVRPRKGGRVRMPDRNFRPMPEEGSFVPLIDYYNRLILTGDVVIAEPPTAEAPAAAEHPAPDEPEEI